MNAANSDLTGYSFSMHISGGSMGSGATRAQAAAMLMRFCQSCAA